MKRKLRGLNSFKNSDYSRDNPRYRIAISSILTIVLTLKYIKIGKNMKESAVINCAIELLKKERALDLIIEKHDFLADAIGDLQLLDIALDLLGIPADNTVEMCKKYGNPKGLFASGCYCRDWIFDLYNSIIKDNEDYELFIKVLKDPDTYLPKESVTNELLYEHCKNLYLNNKDDH